MSKFFEESHNLSWTIKNKKSVVYFLIPGFIGNYEDGFIKNIYYFLLSKKFTVKGLKFKGHQLGENKLMKLDEMVLQVKREFRILRNKNKNKEIVVLAHSQGCAISLKALEIFDEKTVLVFFSPAIFMSEIIPKRIGKNDFEVIKKGKTVNAQVSRTKKKIIDLDWYLSYKNFFIGNEINKATQEFLIIRPADDYIDKKNINFLLNNLKNSIYLEVPGDHSFEKPGDSFEKLVEEIF